VYMYVCRVMFCAYACMYIVYMVCGVHVVCMYVASLHVHQYWVWMCVLV